jgi:polyhydroxyalkanoate synthesis regulator phasin
METATNPALARAILETTIAIRDTANEVNEIVKDLKERGTIKDTARAVVETTNATRNTIEKAKAAIETKVAMPPRFPLAGTIDEIGSDIQRVKDMGWISAYNYPVLEYQGVNRQSPAHLLVERVGVSRISRC